MGARSGTRRAAAVRGGARAPGAAVGPTPWVTRGLALAVVGLTVWAYRGSLGGPFIWDDLPVIPDNPRIRALGWDCLTGTSRPLVQLTFALNHALGGLDVRGYHVFNLAIHLLAALALFGVAVRTLRGPRLGPRLGRRAPWLAAAIAGLWAVHPLQTESVTYVVQRAESLAGLLQLLLLYALVRGAESARSRAWSTAAVACAVLGTAAKPVMAVAPLVALLYDRCFLAGSFRAALARRRGLYAGLCAGVGVLPIMLALGPNDWRPSTGFALHGLTAGGYALTQLAVVPHYLRLAVWPAPLVLDYAWPTVRGLADVVPGALVVLTLLVLTTAGLARNHPLGFLGAAFVVLLAPTSSFIPVADAAFEHRMYLPLAAVVATFVAGLAFIAGPRREADRSTRGTTGAVRAGPVAALVLGCAAVVALAHGTIQRNKDYRSAVAIWRDTVRKNPRNPRAHTQLGQALAAADRGKEALAEFVTAVDLNPDYGPALGDLTHALEAAGRIGPAEAIHDYSRALELDPSLQWARIHLGFTLIRAGRPAAAAAQFAEAVRRAQDFAPAHYGLGVARTLEGRAGEGRTEFERALVLDPGDAVARHALSWIDSVGASTRAARHQAGE